MRHDDTCSSCRAPIRWAVHETTGRRMPLDPSPVADGNVVVVEWRETSGVFALPVIGVGAKALDRAVTRYRYTSHFATCPNAKRHRRDRGAGEAIILVGLVGFLFFAGLVAYFAMSTADDDNVGPTTPAECQAAGGTVEFNRQGEYVACWVGGAPR